MAISKGSSNKVSSLFPSSAEDFTNIGSPDSITAAWANRLFSGTAELCRQQGSQPLSLPSTISPSWTPADLGELAAGVKIWQASFGFDTYAPENSYVWNGDTHYFSLWTLFPFIDTGDWSSDRDHYVEMPSNLFSFTNSNSSGKDVGFWSFGSVIQYEGEDASFLATMTTGGFDTYVRGSTDTGIDHFMLNELEETPTNPIVYAHVTLDRGNSGSGEILPAPDKDYLKDLKLKMCFMELPFS